MVSAKLLTQEQIDELVEIARGDPVFWEAMKDRETNQLNDDGSAKIPSMSMLVDDLVKRKYGQDHIFDIGSLIVQLRSHILKDLGQIT